VLQFNSQSQGELYMKNSLGPG